MEKHTFGRTGYEVTRVGFGGAPIGLLETEQQEVSTILNMLLDEGVNLIDTAAAYEGSEVAIGKAVSHRRDQYVLVSKCGSPSTPESDDWHPNALLATVDRALARLNTDHLDVMLLHSGGMDILKRGDALEALVRARDAGKIRHVGYSGDNEDAAYAVTLPDIAVLETSVNICDQANIDTVLPYAKKHNVGVIAKRPIANAAWKARAEQPGFYQEYSEVYADRLSRMNVSPADLGFEGEPSQLWPEIALRFTMSIEEVHTAIIGTTNADHARANLAAVARGALPREAVQCLREAFHGAQSTADEAWVAET
jgi:aryl-alcohol dehydrogenase-like predicted oxidoreductase